MSPALNGSSEIQHFEHVDVIKIRDGIMFLFYPGLPRVCTPTDNDSRAYDSDGTLEPITQREGALNLCMYADSTCCQIALAQHSLYGKCYVSAII